MDKIEYKSTQDQLLLISQVLVELDLEGFLEKIVIANNIGPFMNPTLWMDGQAELAEIKQLAEYALRIKLYYKKLIKMKQTAPLC